MCTERRYTCTSQFAKARTTPKGRSLPVCVPPTAYANGSALVFYNSTSYRDDMVWAAAWMYKATGDRVSHPANIPRRPLTISRALRLLDGSRSYSTDQAIYGRQPCLRCSRVQ